MGNALSSCCTGCGDGSGSVQPLLVCWWHCLPTHVSTKLCSVRELMLARPFGGCKEQWVGSVVVATWDGLAPNPTALPLAAQCTMQLIWDSRDVLWGQQRLQPY